MGTGTLSLCRNVCAVAGDPCTFLVKMLGRGCHDAGVRWEAVPAPGLPQTPSLQQSLSGCQVIIGATVGWQGGKGVLSSALFLQTQMVNKRKFFPLVFFDFHASVSTFLWWELFGICCSWHLSAGSWLDFELLTGQLCSSHTRFCSP